MPILDSEIQYRFSGGAANSNPNNSLGGEISSTEWTGTLFDDVSAAQASAGSVEYRCVYIANTDPALPYVAAKLWIQSNTPSPNTSIAIGLGTSAAGGVEQTVANETTAPTGVSFSEVSTAETGLSLGDVVSGSHRAVWIRRTVNAGTAAVNDTWTLRVQGETAA